MNTAPNVSSVMALPRVAFKAVIITDVTVQEGNTVRFPNVLFNEGNGYNSDTGVFKAPKVGNYAFQFHGVSCGGKNLGLDIYQNDEYWVSAFVGQQGNCDNGGNTITLWLALNDTVYVKASRKSDLQGTASQGYNSFEGYLLESH